MRDALVAVREYLRRKAPDFSQADRDDIASAAVVALIEKSSDQEISEPAALAVALAKGMVANAIRKRERRAAALHRMPVHDGSGATAEDIVIAASEAQLSDADVGVTADKAQRRPAFADASNGQIYAARAQGPEDALPLEAEAAAVRASRMVAVLRGWLDELHDPELGAEQRREVVAAINSLWAFTAAPREVEVRLALMCAVDRACAEPVIDGMERLFDAPARVRSHFSGAGHGDVALFLPDAAVCDAVQAWNRGPGGRAGLKKFEAMSALLRCIGDQGAGASPDALKKLWQRRRRALE